MPDSPTTLREQLRTLLPDEGYTITADEVMATVEHGRVEGSLALEPAPVMSRRRFRGLAPALVWMLGLLVLVATGVGVFVGVNGTSPSKPAPVGGTGTSPSNPAPVGGSERLSDHLVLDAKRTVAGQSVDGNLVIYNPGKIFNLTKGCQPQLAVGLKRGKFHQQIAFAAVCDGTPLLIDHGTTRLPVTVRYDIQPMQPIGTRHPVPSEMSGRRRRTPASCRYLCGKGRVGFAGAATDAERGHPHLDNPIDHNISDDADIRLTGCSAVRYRTDDWPCYSARCNLLRVCDERRLLGPIT